MYAIILESAFFCSGHSFNQLLNVVEARGEALLFTKIFINENPTFQYHSFIIKEIFNNDISRIDLKINTATNEE